MADQSSRNQPQVDRKIPDGGLAASGLPDWMQSKPEWSTHPSRADVVATTIRETPVPDSSIIDLASILTVDDLPIWLQDVARRPPHIGTEVDTGKIPADGDGNQGQTTAKSVNPDLLAGNRVGPWWAGDRMMAGLLIAIVLTILFVLVTAIRAW